MRTAEPHIKRNLFMPHPEMMPHHVGGWMTGWGGGGLWIWAILGVVVVILLAVIVNKVTKKK